MWQLLLASDNLAFSVALALVCLLAVVELLLSLLGVGMSGSLDLEMDLDAVGFLSWLRLGTLPLLVWFIVALTAFGLTGLALQALLVMIVGHTLSPLLAISATLILCLPLVRLLGGGLRRIMPRDETTAISAEALVGRLAVIVQGTARLGSPAEAKLRDEHGQTHYFLVEPGDEAESFTTGTEVLLLEYSGSVYRAMRNPL